MKYGFLTTLIPKSLENEVRSLSINNMQDAANALQWHIYDGLCKNINDEIRLFNILPISSYPQYYKKAFIKSSIFTTYNSFNNLNIGFCNIKLLRKYHQQFMIYNTLRKWCKSTNDDKTLFVYTISAPFINAVNKLKKEFTDLKVCAIVADLPNMSDLSSKKSFFKKLFTQVQSNSSYSHLNCIDAFVLLTEHMADYMKIKQPYCVVEGIATSSSEFDKYIVEKNDNLIRIMYSGTLHRRFGILNLVEAFKLIENPNCRLVICGIGDSENEIKQAALDDSRIEYYGQLHRDKVLELQAKSDVLVNPRQNIEEFTKYSFPSKNLEYLSSGKPLIAYKLDGIPDEYDYYINYVQDNSVEALKYLLEKICFFELNEANIKAEQAKMFVQNKKNSKEQTLKIIKLIRS